MISYLVKNNLPLQSFIFSQTCMDGVQGTPHPPPAAFACFFSCEQVKSSVNLSRLAKLNTYLYSLNFPQSPYRRRLRSRITHSPWFPWVLTASVVPLDFHDLGSLVVLTNVPFGVALVFFLCLVRGCEFCGRSQRRTTLYLSGQDHVL